MRIHIEYSHALDPMSWQARHEAGLVPDRLPYGLDRIAAHGFELSVRGWEASRAVRFLDGASRRLSGGFALVDALRDRVRRNCDVAFCWDERTGVPAALRSALPGEPPAVLGIIWATDSDARLGRRGRALTHAALRRARAVWAMSPAQLGPLADEWGVRRERLHLLHMGIDVDFWAAADAPTEPELVIGGGNDRHRDHATLVRAMALLRRRRPALRLELATHLPADLPAELGVKHPHLSHPEMRDLYGRAAVVALALKPNLHLSGLSVMLETMARGRPLVVTATPGMEEYVTDGENGLLVPPGDAEALSAAVDRLLSDPDYASAVGGAGRRAVEQRFSTRLQALAFAEILSNTPL
jgi:glycosyltransferase involved in cell wall biosynthesis